MAFSDASVKILREIATRRQQMFTTNCLIVADDVLELLLRLEAAERIAELDARHNPKDPHVIAWREACGHPKD